MMVRLPDDDGQPGQAFTLHLDDSVHQNAQRYFEAARKQKDKTAGATAALEDTKVAFKRAEKEAKQKQVAVCKPFVDPNACGFNNIVGA